MAGLHDPTETSTGPGCFAAVCTVSSAHQGVEPKGQEELPSLSCLHHGHPFQHLPSNTSGPERGA